MDAHLENFKGKGRHIHFPAITVGGRYLQRETRGRQEWRELTDDRDADEEDRLTMSRTGR